MKRLFIGSFINDKNFFKNYTKVKKDFSSSLKGKWVPNKNLHITYKFLGNVEEEKIPEIQNILKEIISKPIDVDLVFKGISAFPSIENPKIVFIKVEDKNKKLNDIYKLIEDQLQQLKFEKENREFTPHITIKRPKFVKKDEFLKMVQNYKDKVIGKKNKIDVNLIESVLTPKGAIYTKM